MRRVDKISPRTELIMNRPPRSKQKLKDSCNNCAFAKVKCNRAKPVCSRCEDRDLVCFYGPSHRFGRRPAASRIAEKRESNKNALEKVVPLAPAPSLPPPPPYSLEIPPPLTAPAGTPSIYESTLITDLSMVESSLPFGSHNETFPLAWDEPLLTAATCQFSGINEFNDPNGFWNAMDSSYYSLMDTPLNALQTPPEDEPAKSLFPSEPAISMPPVLNRAATGDIQHPWMGIRTAPDSPSVLQSTTNPGHDPHKCPGAGSHSSQCMPAIQSCLANLDKAASDLDIETIIRTNREVLEQIMEVLDCSCFASNEQLQLLAVVLAFKVMSRYAVAALDGQPSASASTGTGLSSPVNRGIHERARLVLGELYRVVRLVNRLSGCFKKEKIAETSPSPKLAGSEASSTEFSGMGGHHVSASVFVQLEEDLHRRFRVLRDDIIAVLRSL
ncbi:Fungal Zn binuclear cluster domain containing protein [Coccidioides posadasii C735 delta SOWgp]|uniref:Fungal Zn binuclear cluster domain containing protein n=1 Tax=Coccidioides posadasii (strain C735) TaxID=222929 RepID=C5P3S9_COCP7|nr:Fungal Zn binuclear cluster domain containing protein [Coccidioides posadasii C735 delta SOWgp]EER28347.1 Fungal Zn binuclear cluster domain containing protein [Coccidioides posadasii C735 delta SOWgp]|eukprot:XP_003070492.1 Fungal Zn binuclear cluster domain containing protein [Coccidioides posadasii C735 delta SOWgp]